MTQNLMDACNRSAVIPGASMVLLWPLGQIHSDHSDGLSSSVEQKQEEKEFGTWGSEGGMEWAALRGEAAGARKGWRDKDLIKGQCFSKGEERQ